MRVIEGSMEQRKNEGTGEMRDPRENTPTCIGDRTRLALMGGKQGNHSATVAPPPSMADHKLFDNPHAFDKLTKRMQLIVGATGIYAIGVFSFDMWVGGDRIGLDRTICMCSYFIHLINLIICLNYSNWALQIMKRLEILNVKLHQVSCKSHEMSNTGNDRLTRGQRYKPTVDRSLQSSMSPVGDPVVLHSSVFRGEEIDIFYLRVLFEKVSKCIFLMNDAYGLQMLLTIMTNCFCCLGHILNALYFKTIDPHHPANVVCVSFLWTVLYLSQSACIVLSCRDANMEVNRTLEIIQEIILERREDEGVTEQLSLFHDQVSSRDFTFSAGGILKIDCSLFGYTIMSVASNLLMRMSEMSMEQHRNVRAEKTGDPRENPPTSGIFRHDTPMRKSGSDPAED
ncbi:hypothetical protein PR048_010172 [Dryococelus australis]|uniref:Gustatory receptor n=1 Tax=Dryococelus australis TaxID=614101 RepID=A0ABQ9I3X2_9NEOP|nr:hypothetical protein PR048_010172 [Dryococelus australis]